VAKKARRESKLVDINVFFGNDPQNPLPIGHQQENHHGVLSKYSIPLKAEWVTGGAFP